MTTAPCPLSDTVNLFADGEADAATVEMVRAHPPRCESCTAELLFILWLSALTEETKCA